MAFTMNAVHDELVYVATIKNKGTLACEIVDIIESPDYKLDSFNNGCTVVTLKSKGFDINDNEIRNR